MKIAKGIPPPRIPNVGKKVQDKEDEINKKYINLISDVMIGNSNYIGISLNGLIQEVQ